MGFFVVVIFGLIFGALSSQVAASKGYDSSSWFWAGLLLGPFGLIAICGMPDRRTRRYLREIALAVGAKEESLGDDADTDASMTSMFSSTMKAGEGEVFQVTGSTPDSIWNDLVGLLPLGTREMADPESSEYFRTKIIVRNSDKKILARFHISQIVRQGKFWKLAKVFPRP